jgi:WD40 repeat protein
VQAAEALEHAHRCGVVHRDIKPANLLVDEAGHLWVTDFGLALLCRHDRLTRTGDVVGTLHYMAPEQAVEVGAVDQRADVYGLGATLYELLAGRPAFDSPAKGELLRQVLEVEPRPLRRLNPAVPADLETIVLKCLAKRGEERYATAQELADDLRCFLEDRPIRARPPSLGQRLSKWGWRHRRAGAGVLGMLVVALVGLTVAMAFIRQALRDRTTALEKVRTAQAGREEAVEREQRHAARSLIAQAFQEWQDGKVGRMLQVLDDCPLAARRWEWHYLNGLGHTDQLTLRRLSGILSALGISPDGRHLVTATFSGQRSTIQLWDANTGREIWALTGPDAPVLRVAFRPDGEVLATSAFGKPVQLWRVADRTLVSALREDTSSVWSIAFSQDNRLFVTGSTHGDVTIWDAATGEVRHTFRTEGRIDAVACAARGPRSLLAAAGRDLKVWDLTTGEELLSLRRPAEIPALAFSPDGQRLAVPQLTELTVLEAMTGKQVLSLPGHTETIRGVAFSPDGKLLVSGANDRTVRLWDAATGKLLRRFRGHDAAVTHVGFSPDGRRLFSGSHDGVVKAWDAEQDQEQRSLHGHQQGVFGIAFSPDGRCLASGSRDGTVILWDVRKGQKQLVFRGQGDRVLSVTFSPDGRRLASGGWGSDRPILVWDRETGVTVHTLVREGGAVGQLAFSPDGHLLAAASSGKDSEGWYSEVRVWDAGTGREVSRLQGRRFDTRTDPPGCGVAFSPDSRLLAWSEEPSSLSVRELATGREVLRCRGINLTPSGIVFSPDGRRLAAAGEGADVCVWDAVPSEAGVVRDPRFAPKNRAGLVRAVAFSPDGERLATTCNDGTVKLWDAETGWEVLSLRGSRAALGDVAFSPDGSLLAAASNDGTVLIWDARSQDAAESRKDE